MTEIENEEIKESGRPRWIKGLLEVIWQFLKGVIHDYFSSPRR